jgi:enoyl-CoA hydratase
MTWDDYEHLRFQLDDVGVLRITIDRPEVMNATNARLHGELANVWLDVARDPEVRVALITGAGRAFSAGGDLELLEQQVGDFSVAARVLKEARDCVFNMIDCEKPIISAINGAAVGAGLTVALMADISIIAEDARFSDGHMRLGVTAGDHAAIIWPLLCGLAKAKYYLLTADFIDGKEAERIGLVSLCVPREELMERADAVALKLATGPQHALRWTKRSLNHWLRNAGPIFESSLGYEFLNFFDADIREGILALREKRSPVFPSVASHLPTSELRGRGSPVTRVSQ